MCLFKFFKETIAKHTFYWEIASVEISFTIEFQILILQFN